MWVGGAGSESNRPPKVLHPYSQQQQVLSNLRRVSFHDRLVHLVRLLELWRHRFPPVTSTPQTSLGNLVPRQRRADDELIAEIPENDAF